MVDSFLRHTFGYDPNIKWEVADIRPGEDPAISVVTIVLRTPQGAQEMKLLLRRISDTRLLETCFRSARILCKSGK